jgi:hypothetical protein
MAQLHEVIAVESDLNATAQKMIDEAIITFTKKPDTYNGSVRSLTMLDASRSGEDTTVEVPVGDTVPAKLEYVGNSFSKYIDAVLQKEATNQEAKADLVVEGQTIATQLPATFLLGLENRLKRIRDLYTTAPTLKPGLRWEVDVSMGDEHFRAEDRPTFKTEKTVNSKVLYEATKEHPAQIEKWTEDVNVGRVETTHMSGMISPARKAVLLGRIDTLIRAVKRARMKANQQEVVDRSVGADLWAYINA